MQGQNHIGTIHCSGNDSTCYALADCNNFFVSCERAFNPALEKKPVIVLSNNDGCVIARSNEAKAIGIKMGDPFFKIREAVRKYKIHVFSGNMQLYADMSARVHATLREFIPEIEIYSIDEAFIDLGGIQGDMKSLGEKMAYICRRNTGIPVSIGISKTKTLAKIASKLCKQYPKLHNSCYMHRPEDIETVLKKFPIKDVWGIGRRTVAKLDLYNITTAWDFISAPEDMIRGLMGINGVRTRNELSGIPCIAFEDSIKSRQSIMTSRSFTKEITDMELLSEQIAEFTAMSAEKLRKQGSLCGEIMVFACTNRFRTDETYRNSSAVFKFESPTDSSIELCTAAVRLAHSVFLPGTGYKRAGVCFSDISGKEILQPSLFAAPDRFKHDKLMDAMDRLNKSMGGKAVLIASEGSGKIANTKDHMSPHYTTDWNDIPVAHV